MHPPLVVDGVAQHQQASVVGSSSVASEFFTAALRSAFGG
jgi:hypothetical protein